MKRIFIFGAGAIGTALAIHLTLAGKRVVLVRVRQRGMKRTRLALTHDGGGASWNAEVDCLSLDQIERPEGLLVVTTKAFANPGLAETLIVARSNGPICVLQNGMGVEQPFLDKGFSGVCRGILYVTGEKCSKSRVSLKVLQPSLIGNADGNAALADEMVQLLTTAAFPFQRSDGIEREVWKKRLLIVFSTPFAHFLIPITESLLDLRSV